MANPPPLPARRVFILTAALAAACLIPAIRRANALDIPHAPRLDASPSGEVFGGFQLIPGEGGSFELFTCSPDGGGIRHLGRYNGLLAGVAIAPGGRLLALTRDGALGSYGDDGETICLPDDRWNMRALALLDGVPLALNLDNGAFHLVRPGPDQGWAQDRQGIADAGAVMRAELLLVNGEPHALWHSRSGDLSRGEIRHAVMRDGAWREEASLPLGDLDAFAAHVDANGRDIVLAAHAADATGAGNGRLIARVLREGEWREAALPNALADRLMAAHSFASAPGGGGTLWLSAGLDGAHVTRADAGGDIGPAGAVAPGMPAESVWPHLAGFVTLAALALLFVLYCRRSKTVSRNFPGRPPDLISRGAALGIDWFLSSAATGAYHIASGDMRILPDLVAMGDVQELFWVNMAALCVFMGVSETLFGCTPGKWLAGLRVRSVRGGAPTFSQTALRNLVRVLDMYPLAGFPGLVGMIVTFFGPGRQRLGDMLAGTVVRRHADLGSRQLLLASASPRRLELIRELGMEVRVQPSSIDEDGVKGDTPEETVKMLSQAKARDGGVNAQSGEIVVAADTVVVLDGTVLGKPSDAADARRMLGALSGRSHSVYTGVTVWDSATGQGVTDVEETEVEFRELPASEIDAYVATGDPLDKAGGYGVQTGRLVKQVRGSLSNVAGLPMEKLQSMLSSLDS